MGMRTTFYSAAMVFLAWRIAREAEGASATEAQLRAEWARMDDKARADLVRWLAVPPEEAPAPVDHTADMCDGLCRAHGGAR